VNNHEVIPVRLAEQILNMVVWVRRPGDVGSRLHNLSLPGTLLDAPLAEQRTACYWFAALMLAVSTANISLGRWEMTIASCASPRT